MKIPLSIIFLALCSFVSATDYYISSSGDDINNSGLSASSPWKTIAKANQVFPALKPGDRILFRRGDTFYGKIEIAKPGVEGSPITLGAYGTGEKPIITGFTVVSGWKDEGNGIYSASMTSESLTNMVTIDGIQYAMGRWPDGSYNIFETAATNTSITDVGLGDATDWDGAEVVIRKNDWSLDRCQINDHSGDRITYTSLGTTQDAEANHGYFIQNDLRCLSRFGEWYHDPIAEKIYIYFGSVDATTLKIEVATKNTLVLNDGHDYIIIDDLHFRGSISHAITYLSYVSNHCTIQNSIVDFAGLDGIHLLGDYGTISSNLISNCNQTGINAVGTYEKVTLNDLKNIGVLPGQAMNGSLTSGLMIAKNNCFIEKNDIENIGYCGIALSSTADIITIQNNFLNNILLVLNDGGGIYTAGEGTSRKIDGNIIMNVIGNTSGTPYPNQYIARGIYLDVNSTNVLITNNTVANCTESGYMIHKAYENKLENNTAFNNGYAMFFQNSSGSNIRNNVLRNNIFFATTSSQLALKFYSIADDIPSFGSADNNYYTRPVNDNEVFQTYSPSTGFRNRTLSGWQSFTNQDLNSKKSLVSVNDTSKIDFYFNATGSNKIIPLAQPMVDVKGVKYSGSLTLLPYTSVILLPDPNPTQPAIPIYSGSVIENAAPSLLVMTYNINLANIVPSSNAFTVKVNGTNSNVTTVSISGSKVMLTLASPVVYGDNVTVTYTVPSSSALQASSGGQAVSIIAQSVENNCVSPVNQPPVVIISSPTKGASYISPATLTIDVEASDPDGTISKVELFNGSAKLGETEIAPYSFTLKDLPEGSYSLHVTATDNLKSTTISSVINLRVTSYNENSEFFNLYPNPNNGQFSINFTAVVEAEKFTVTVVNFIGRTVYREELNKEEIISQFDLSHLNPGTYIMIITTNEIILTQKFIKG